MRSRWLVASVLSLAAAAFADEQIQPEIYTGLSELKAGESQEYMVVAAHPLATEAGLEMLAQGGSAVDAAIAVQLALTLVEPQSSGIGGGGFLMHFDNEANELKMYDGRETAPAAIDPSNFVNPDGSPMGFYRALVGGRSVGVPGVVAAMELAHQQHGKLPWEKLFEPAIRLAENGFPVSPRMHQMISGSRYLRVNDTIENYFFIDGVHALPEGHTLKNPEYAQTLRMIAQDGAKAFYTGEIAERIVNAVNNDPSSQGVMTMADLANYRPVQREPVCKEVFEHRICSAAPPSSGGVTLLAHLRMVELIGRSYQGAQDPQFIADFAGAANVSFADRNQYLADSDFVEVPVEEMLDESYLARRAAILRNAIIEKAEPGEFAVSRITTDSPEQVSTTHFSIVDAEGNAVSMTSSIEMGFGSRVMAAGFLLNNQLTDFDFLPRNTRGELVANRVEPNKRPRSSMTPTVVFTKNGELRLLAGSPGGSRIISYTAQAIANVLLFDMSPAEAVAVPHVIARNTGSVEVETSAGEPYYKADLEEMGFSVRTGHQNSGLHLIERQGDRWVGGADPRREGVVGVPQ